MSKWQSSNLSQKGIPVKVHLICAATACSVLAVFVNMTVAQEQHDSLEPDVEALTLAMRQPSISGLAFDRENRLWGAVYHGKGRCLIRNEQAALR